MAAAEVARQLAADTHSGVTAVYVVSELGAADWAAPEAGLDPGADRGGVLAAAEHDLAAFVAEHLAAVEVRTVVMEGKVEDAVTDLAREAGSSFIVVGTMGRGALSRLVLGDTVQAILQRTPCPVVVVPLKEASA